MNTFILNLMILSTVLLSFTSCEAQIKNAKTETVKIYGNCGMCKKTIEKAGNLKNSATVNWDTDSKMATLTYDAKKTNPDAILKRIALSGYDSDKFLSPAAAYAKLPNCCQYDRMAKIAVLTDPETNGRSENPSHNKNHTAMLGSGESELPRTEVEVQITSPLQPVFDHYFAVKDALIQTNGNAASTKAAALLSAINEVKMETLNTKEHIVWMKIVANLKEDTKRIADTKDAKQQRDHFDTLSQNIYDLIKVSKQETPTYLQHCPMAKDGKGANWLSKENAVKNPYYGSMMLSCGKTVETIQ